MVGEGRVSINSLGGNSRHFCGKSMGLEIRVVQYSLGLPGSSSHRNGTDAEVWSGGVSVPDLSGDCLGPYARGFGISSDLGGVKRGSSSASDSISLSKCLYLVTCLCFKGCDLFVLGRQWGKETR